MTTSSNRKNITISLNGGLGNQMFQYAFGRSMALEFGVDLHLDVSAFARDHFYKRKYALDIFRLSEIVTLKKHEFINLLAWKINNLIIKFDGGPHVYGNFLLVEGCPKEFPNSSSLNHVPAYIVGYWQNENYFKKYKQIIKDDFQLLAPVSESTKALTLAMQAVKTPVAMHIRRNHEKSADGVDIEHNNKKIVVTLDYYREAVHLISTMVDSPVFFIFADNPEWAKINLKFISNARFIENTDKHECEDMYLMSRCHHHIVANSSFSWWGAWLSVNDTKQIVVAPKDLQYTPPIPSNWIVI